MWSSEFRTYTISSQNYAGSRTTVILNHENVNFHNIGQGEAQHRKCKKVELGGGQAYDRSIV